MKYIILLQLFLFIGSGVSSGQIMFTDIAPTVGVNDPGNGQGVVFFDFNNDGYLDIYLVNNGQANKLYQNGNGTTFTEVGSTFGVNNNGAGRGCAIGDFDNDGLTDIVVGNFNQTIILYKNNTTSFTNVTTSAGMNLPGFGGAINWLDYNNDGRLDCYYTNDGIPAHYNYLFRNDNLSSFTNVAYSSGLVDSQSTLSAASADYDNDGDFDIFIGAQTGSPTGILYRNNGNGTFTDVSSASGLITYLYTWGADWGDFDNDGDLDLYLSNSNGANQLWRNNGDGTFTEVGNTFGVNDPSQSFSCGWADYDNDGDLDLYVANGTGTDKLYRNDGNIFTDVAATVGTNDTRLSNSTSWGDMNNDGFLDLYLSNNGTENRLYKNNAASTNKWIIFRLRGTASVRSAIGARVRIKTGSSTQIREVQGGSGHNGQNSLPVEFGLGSANTVDSLIIRWPSGTIQSFANINSNQIIDVIEGQPIGILLNNENIPDRFLLMQNYPNPFNASSKFKVQISKLSDAKITVYDIIGKEIVILLNKRLEPGIYEIFFDGTDFNSGVYFYRLETDGLVIETKKMVLLK